MVDVKNKLADLIAERRRRLQRVPPQRVALMAVLMAVAPAERQMRISEIKGPLDLFKINERIVIEPAGVILVGQPRRQETAAQEEVSSPQIEDKCISFRPEPANPGEAGRRLQKERVVREEERPEVAGIDVQLKGVRALTLVLQNSGAGPVDIV